MHLLSETRRILQPDCREMPWSTHCSYYTEFLPEEFENTRTEITETSKKQIMSDYEGKRHFQLDAKYTTPSMVVEQSKRYQTVR